jgi:rhamnose transport system permease protein
MKAFISRWLVRHEVLLLLLVVAEFFFFSSFARKFDTPANLGNIVRHSAELCMLALAVMPVILTGGIDLSIGATMGMCAVLFGVLTNEWQLAPGISACVAVAVGALAGLGNAALIAGLRLPPLIVTLGTMSLFRGIAEGVTTGRKVYGPFGPGVAQWGDATWLGLPAQAWILVVLSGVIFLCVHWTVLGRGWRTIGFAPDGARYAGIPVGRRLVWVYVQSGIIAALAGLLYTARLNQARADIGVGYDLAAITAVVLGGTSILGGIGTVAGTVLGVAAIAILTNGVGRMPAVLNAGIGTELGSLLTGLLLIVALALSALTKFLSERRARKQSAASS